MTRISDVTVVGWTRATRPGTTIQPQTVSAQLSLNHAPITDLPSVPLRFLHAMPHVNFGSISAPDATVAPPKDPAVTLSLHGDTVSDHWRPLEDLDATATTNWWKGQNTRLQSLLGPQRATFDAATRWHEAIRDYTRESMQSRYGTNYVFSRQSGLESQPTFYVLRAPG